ncbi:MAG: hypothetical protein ACJA0M_001054 [Chitinophagales bacterium]|jgi:hypothetical protein
MGPVVEVHSKAGRLLSRQRMPSDSFTVGRGYNNDLLLDDPYVKAEHVHIKANENGDWRIVDADNPYQEAVVKSGEALVVGKTRLKIFDATYAVPTAKNVNDFESSLISSGRLSVCVGLMLLAVVLQAAEAYVSSASEVRWTIVFTEALVAAASFMFIAGFWALLSRLLRHEERFLPLLTVLLKVSVLMWLFDLVISLLGFNLNDPKLIFIIGSLLAGVITAYYFYACLVLVTSLRRRVQSIASLVVGVMVTLLVSADLVIGVDKFSAGVNYSGSMYPPVVIVANGISVEDFISATADVFAKADENILAQD